MKDMSHFTPTQWATMSHHDRMQAIAAAPFLFDDPDEHDEATPDDER